jgi:hypothetical protein
MLSIEHFLITSNTFQIEPPYGGFFVLKYCLSLSYKIKKMAYQKLQVSTALSVIKSDNANIPFPAVVVSGANNNVIANELEDTDVDFVAKNVAIGDVVYNITTNTAATVTKVVDNTRLLLNADIFLATGNSYIVYSRNTKNEGCVLYVGTSGNVRILTAGGQDVVFANVLGGTFLPVQTLKVFATNTTASNIVALW